MKTLAEKAKLDASRSAKEARRRATEDRFDALRPSLTPLHLSQVREAPKRYRLLLKRTVSGGSGYKSATKAFCQRCVGYSDLPASVRGCTDRVCPLWMKRPYQEKIPLDPGASHG